MAKTSQMTVIKKEEKLEFDETIYVATLTNSAALHLSENFISLSSKKEEFDFFQVGKKYELLIRPFVPKKSETELN